MPKIKYLQKDPNEKLFYIVDTCFLVNKYIPPDRINDKKEKDLVINSQEWWQIIDERINSHKAIVYVLNVCIAEAFKALFKQYIKGRIPYTVYKASSDKLRKDLILIPPKAKQQKRFIKFHDIEVNRDIIIGVDRFFESFLKNYPHVSIFDLLILSTSKYLMDFYNYNTNNLVPVTLDNDLWRGSKKIPDIPYVYNPNHKSNYASKVFK